MNKQLAVILATLSVIAFVVVVLATGGQTPKVGGDAKDDLSIDGGAPEGDNAFADISSADVQHDGNDLVFVAEMGGDVPKRIPSGSLEFRWDLLQDGREAWIISATVTSRVVAAVTSQVGTYGASTIDDTLPGTVEVDGSTVTIRIEAGNIEGFPTGFDWRLRTTLDRDLSDPDSGRARDQAPDGGLGRLEPAA